MIDSPIDEIKSRLNVTDVLSEYIQLRKAGVNFKAVCPFHSEKTPSFVISPVKQIWHCFGCGLGGDIFEFVKLIENVEFAQALRILADRAGIELKKPTVSELQIMDKKQLLIEINSAASVYYQKVLWESNAGKEAQDYLRKRGLTDQTIKKWGLGYAPDDFHYADNYLAKRFNKNDIATAGITVKKDDSPRGEAGGSFYDRFRARIMFPIVDIHGDTVGFTGRILKDQENAAKYVNSPETPVYNKSEVIYGLHWAKNQIRKENRAILVEGNMDVITCHQAGFNQTVASSGTAITSQQLSHLQRLCENLIFAFDSDTAGNAATKRALETALSLGFNVKIVDLGMAKDPDELIKKGIGIWQKAVETAPHFVEFFFTRLFKDNDPNSVDGKRQITRELVPLIYRISDQITRAHFVRKLATGINIGESTIWDLVNKVNLPKPVIKKSEVIVRKDRKVILEEQLLGLVINSGAKDLFGEFEIDDFEESNREIFKAIQAYPNAKLETLKEKFPDLANNLELLSFAAQVESEQREGDIMDLRQVANEFQKIATKRRMESLTTRMTEAEKTNDKESMGKLSAEYMSLSAKFSKIPEINQ